MHDGQKFENVVTSSWGSAEATNDRTPLSAMASDWWDGIGPFSKWSVFIGHWLMHINNRETKTHTASVVLCPKCDTLRMPEPGVRGEGAQICFVNYSRQTRFRQLCNWESVRHGDLYSFYDFQKLRWWCDTFHHFRCSSLSTIFFWENSFFTCFT